MVLPSLGSETLGVLITDCMICGEPSKLYNVLKVAEPEAITFCRLSLSEEFIPERRPVLVGYRLVNGNLTLLQQLSLQYLLYCQLS